MRITIILIAAGLLVALLVPQARADVGLTECRQSLNGEGWEDREVGTAYQNAQAARGDLTGAWAWGYYERRNNGWLQRIRFERQSSLYGRAYDVVVNAACEDFNGNGVIGPVGEDWLGSWHSWPYPWS